MSVSTPKHDFDEVIDRRGTDSTKWNSFPADVVPMGVAETDFKCPQPVVDAMIARAAHGLYGYPRASNGINIAVKNWQRTRFGWDIDENWVEFAPGVIPALIYAIRAFTQPGDKVLLQSPVFHRFHHLTTNNGRTIADNTLVLKDGQYTIDFDDLEAKLRDPRTRLLLLCNPHNPVGRAFTREELLRVGNLCLAHDVVVISDEIHSDLVYPGHRHIPFGTLSKEIANNCLVCINPSKTFNTPGLRTSAVITPNKSLREVFRVSVLNNKAEGRTVFGPLAFETCYNECAYYADQLVTYLEGNVQFLLRYFAERIPRIKIIKPEATYLMWLDCRELKMTQDELKAFMLERAKVAMNDGLSFGRTGVGFMRMNIACRRQLLKEALGRIECAINALG